MGEDKFYIIPSEFEICKRSNKWKTEEITSQGFEYRNFGTNLLNHQLTYMLRLLSKNKFNIKLANTPSWTSEIYKRPNKRKPLLIGEKITLPEVNINLQRY